jgi:BlaI family penicillinase repressor
VGRHRPPVSDTELEVLKALWVKSAATVREVLEALAPQKRWAYTTVQTLLLRLENKGYVRSHRSGVAHVFRPIVSREQLLQQNLHELAQRLCEGTASPLVMALVEGVRLTPEEVAELRRWLDEQSTAEEPTTQSKKSTRQ